MKGCPLCGTIDKTPRGVKVFGNCAFFEGEPVVFSAQVALVLSFLTSGPKTWEEIARKLEQHQSPHVRRRVQTLHRDNINRILTTIRRRLLEERLPWTIALVSWGGGWELRRLERNVNHSS